MANTTHKESLWTQLARFSLGVSLVGILFLSVLPATASVIDGDVRSEYRDSERHDVGDVLATFFTM